MDPNDAKAARGGAAEKAKGEQDSAAEGSPQTQPDETGHVPGQWTKEMERRGKEAARYRSEAQRERAEAQRLREEIARRDAEAEAAAAQKLEEQGQYKELNEQLTTKVATQKKTHAAEMAKRDAADAARHAKLTDRFVRKHLEAEMAKRGIKDQAQQDILMPSILARVELTLDDDFEVQGDASKTLDDLVKTLGLGSGDDGASSSSKTKGGKAKPTMHSAVAAVGGTLPTRSPAQPRSGSATQQTIGNAERILGRG